jgi:CDP-diacylglycerol--glycerol-3-phosphate 3-phosphatidyltransferase
MAQSFGVGFYILPIPEWAYPLRDGFMGVAIFLTIWTGIDYIVKWSAGRSKKSSQ